MVNAKGKGNASSSNSSPKNNGAAITSLTETTMSSPIKTNLAEIVVVSESDNKVETLMEEVKNEENAIVVVRKADNAIEEEKNAENSTEEDNNEENAIEEEENTEEDAIEEEQEDEENAREEQKEDKAEANSKEKVKKSRKRNRRKKVAQGGRETLAAKVEDKPESSVKKKTSKKANSMGMIFMCSSKTKKDCYRYKVLGLPASKRDIVQKVYKGMRLFLFDFDLRLMYGIYKAAGPGGYNIERNAFKSAFPSQVRFTVLEDCLPLAEEKFKKVIKDNYYTRNKFDCQLTSEQVKNLCKLFVAASKGPESKKLSRSLRAETHKFLDRDRIRRRGLDEQSRSAPRGKRRYHEHPVMYEREVFASPVAPLPRVPPLPPPAPAPSYAYERTLEMDAYRRDPHLEHRDLRLLDLETRHRDEIGSCDPYISYREPPPYRDPVYSAGLPPEYHRPVGWPPEFLPVGPPYEYRSSAGSLPEYHPIRPLHRY